MIIKPIFVIYFPVKYLKSEPSESREKIESEIISKLSDYHILFAATSEAEVQFKGFYPQDFDVDNFEKFKEIVSSKMKIVEEKLKNSDLEEIEEKKKESDYHKTVIHCDNYYDKKLCSKCSSSPICSVTVLNK